MKLMNKKISILAGAVIATMLLSGCSHNLKSVEVAKVQKSFKTPLERSEIKGAVVDAALDKGWELANASGDIKSFELKKEFVKYKRLTGRENRWKRVEKKYIVNAKVSIENNTLVIEPTQKSIEKMKKHDQKELFNKELVKLEKEIYNNLISKIL